MKSDKAFGNEYTVPDLLWRVKCLGGNGMKKLADLLAGIPMTIAGGICLLLSFVLPHVGIVLPIDPA